MKLIEYKETRNVITGGTETMKKFRCSINDVARLCGVVGFGMNYDARSADYAITNQEGDFCGSFHCWDESGVGTLDIWEV